MLEHLFGSKTRIKLLQIFFRSPEQSFFVRELSRVSGVQLNAVRRELMNLTKCGIVEPVAPKEKSEHAGTERSKFYHLNMGSLLYVELKALLIKARILEEQEFIEEIKNKVGLISFFLLTGLFTNVDDVGTDMLLVGKIKPQTLDRLLKEYEKNTGNSVRYTVMDDKEFEERREIGDKFLYTVFEARHLTVVDKYEIG